jgi:molecular chaperone GrpE
MSENPEHPDTGAADGGEVSEQQREDAGAQSQRDISSEIRKERDPIEKIALLEAERIDLRDRMLRIAAEFENYKKRVRREQSENENKARESVLKDMLEVADNLERAAAAVEGASDIKALQQGVALVLRLFQSKLERYDVKPLEAKGQPFDPRLHDAISQVPSTEAPPGSVLNEVQKGYRIGERLLRPAMVVVAVAPPAAAPQANGSAADDSGKT